MKIHSVIAFGLASIAALPAAAGSVSDTDFTISSSTSGTQFDTMQAGTADFANSANLAGYSGSLVTPVASITGGQLNPGGSTNPGSGVSGGTIANYIVASNGNPITITFGTTQSYFGLLWGSMDATNTITFYNGATAVASYTGQALENDTIGAVNYPAAASYINFNATAAGDFNKIVFSDSTYDFEIGNLAANTAPVPLPASVYLMFAGLGVLGFYARKRKLTV